MPLPDHGMSREDLFAESALAQVRRCQVGPGSDVQPYLSDGSRDVDEVLMEANRLYLYENALNPIRFPVLARWNLTSLR